MHFHALQQLPLAEATAVLFVFPLALTALAALVLKERVGPLRWAAVAAGLCRRAVRSGIADRCRLRGTARDAGLGPAPTIAAAHDLERLAELPHLIVALTRRSADRDGWCPTTAWSGA